MAVRTSLASPAILRENGPDSSELVFTGQRLGRDGEPFGEAALEFRGISAQADSRGIFALLMECQRPRPRPMPGPSGLAVSVLAPDDEATDHSITTRETGRVSDGTLVIFHDFALGPG